MTVGNNDLHENELFNVFTVIKTGIKIQIKPPTNAFLLRYETENVIKNAFHMCQF